MTGLANNWIPSDTPNDNKPAEIVVVPAVSVAFIIPAAEIPINDYLITVGITTSANCIFYDDFFYFIPLI